MSEPTLQTILYIEDDPDMREVVILVLEMIGGIAVRAFSTGDEALGASEPLSPDLLLLDVMMPGVDGPATLGRLRQDPRFAATPAIFLTAKANPAEIRRLVDLGAIGVVGKPFDPATLADEIRELWSGRHGR
jgi:CheY-like chemotaxis protein